MAFEPYVASTWSQFTRNISVIFMPKHERRHQNAHPRKIIDPKMRKIIKICPNMCQNARPRAETRAQAPKCPPTCPNTRPSTKMPARVPKRAPACPNVCLGAKMPFRVPKRAPRCPNMRPSKKSQKQTKKVKKSNKEKKGKRPQQK